MPGPTLYKYFRSDKSKRQSIGNGVWPNITLLSDSDITFMVDVLAQSDCGKNFMSRQEAIYAIQEVNPTLDWKQAKDMLERRVLPKSYADGKNQEEDFEGAGDDDGTDCY